MPTFVNALITYTDAKGHKKIIETVKFHNSANTKEKVLPPGGQLDEHKGEKNIFYAAKREAAEELGLDLRTEQECKDNKVAFKGNLFAKVGIDPTKVQGKHIATMVDEGQNAEHNYILFDLGTLNPSQEKALEETLIPQDDIEYGAVGIYDLQDKSNTYFKLGAKVKPEDKDIKEADALKAFNGLDASGKPKEHRLKEIMDNVYKQVTSGKTEFKEYVYNDKGFSIKPTKADSSKSFLDYCKEDLFDKQYHVVDLKDNNKQVIGRRVAVSEQNKPDNLTSTIHSDEHDVFVYADKVTCAAPTERSYDVMAKLAQQRFKQEKDVLLEGDPKLIAEFAEKCKDSGLNIYVKGADGTPKLYEYPTQQKPQEPVEKKEGTIPPAPPPPPPAQPTPIPPNNNLVQNSIYNKPTVVEGLDNQENTSGSSSPRMGNSSSDN